MISKRLLVVIVLSISLISFLLIKDKSLMIDEGTYYRLIVKVASFHFTSDLLDNASSLPGYVISIGVLEHFLKISEQSSRMVTTLFSLLSVLIFYIVARSVDRKVYEIKTLQYFFFPILFIFFFLLYNDVYSLLYILITFLLVLKRRYYWAGIFGFLSLLIRQTNLTWLGFFCTYIMIDKYSLFIKTRDITKYLRDIAVFLASFVATIVFIFINKGAVIVGEANQQIQPLSFHFENIFFILFLFFFLFLPLNLANFPKIIKLFRTKLPINLLLILSLIDIFLIYFLTFKADHPYNTHGDIFLRNMLLNYTVENPLRKSIFFLPIAYSILSLCVSPLINKKYYLIYPFTFIFLSMSWLVEQRYYLIPFTFFILFKKSQFLLVEFSTLAIYVVLAEIIFFGTISGRFFL